MVLKSFEQLIERVKANPVPRRAAVASAGDRHTLEAVFQATDDGLIYPLLTGEKREICAILDKIGRSADECDIYDEPGAEKAAERAVALVREGRADFLIKGKLETSQLLRPVVSRETGLRRGGVMSHMAIQTLPRYHKMIVTTDGGMLLNPTLEEKKALIRNAVEFLRAIGYENPKVAVLAASETVNSKMQDSLDGAELKAMNQRGEISGCIVEGPISFDLAMVKERAAAKGYESPVAGDADILVCPSITCGNVLGKSFVEMAGAVMAGLVLGAKVPIVLTSRGSSSLEKYLSIALAAAGTGASS
ncbi:MAG: bifunctional enoyl-CoA hydratase/phosphate acetyltransferase [Oscillospiraceae bacterium]|jgi:phosphate butyryltransferase|nr:bifunctional enoyl-CoA hydratase/phosphate acetyltransferase [Oscillospiraceae bacterium]